jgi:hypothetical protein
MSISLPLCLVLSNQQLYMADVRDTGGVQQMRRHFEPAQANLYLEP